jgi:hypothetical protein
MRNSVQAEKSFFYQLLAVLFERWYILKVIKWCLILLALVGIVHLRAKTTEFFFYGVSVMNSNGFWI